MSLRLANLRRRGKHFKDQGVRRKSFARVAPGRSQRTHREVLRKPRRIYRRGNEYLSAITKRFTRFPAGHPEAFLEAFANVYVEIARAVEAEVGGQPIPPDCDFPTVDDGVDGMAFIATAVKSAKAGGVWTRMIELRKS